MVKTTAKIIMALAVISLTAKAKAAPRDLFVVADLSGSMYQKMDGMRRLDMLRGPINSYLQSAAADQTLGLIRFGVKAKGCDSSEYNPAISAKVLGRLLIESAPKPYAQTPLTPALALLKKHLHPKNQTRIFIVSDGENTCGDAACGMIAELKKINPNIDFDVLLLGENEKALNQLSCIRTSIRVVKNPTELSDALIKLQAQTTATADAKTPDPDLGMGAVRIRNLPDFDIFQAKMIKPHHKSQPKLTTVEESQGENAFPLSPGTYLISLPKYSAVAKVTIKPQRTTELDFYHHFNLPPARIKVFHQSYGAPIKYTISSGRGRELLAGEWQDTRPGKQLIRITYPESISGMIIAGLQFEPAQKYEFDLTESVGVYQNPNPFAVVLRNETLFDTHSVLVAGTAYLLKPHAQLALAPGAYVIEKLGQTIAELNIGGEPTHED